MLMGSAGQQSRVLRTGVPYVQKSRKSRRRGDAKITHRHLLHTCTSLCHSHVSIVKPYGKAKSRQ
ncbi:hypothetical protein B0F90DRAFT_1750815 [Multifurca ochricompacta]|uniref:Uncharacterized protein n=1 Tax=Multifurca ochricompacta TaxID=376703 RepID=A0AAD4LZH3_9AGAM|nr:hypothetical protein B0F90DRAFT_1750815 [Multifurca ochricompacta]